MTPTVVLRHAEVEGHRVDVVWRDGVVVSLHEAARAPAPRGAVVVPCDGGAVLPGLHDHHLHLMALAAARASVVVGPPQVTTPHEFAVVLAEAVRQSSGGWVRAVGYHDSVAGALDTEVIEALVPEGRTTPIRVQHRSGQMWVLNHKACDEIHLDRQPGPGIERDAAGRPTGRIVGRDDLVRQARESTTLDMAAIGRELASYGVTGVTDCTPTTQADDVERLAEAVGAFDFPLRVTITGGLGLPDDAARTLPRGPVKFLPADHDLPSLDDLARGIASAHELGRPVAVHCVSRVGLVIAMAAWREAGAIPGDRIEHGAVVPDDLLHELSTLGLIVVTQPNFVAERGDRYLAEVETDDLPHLWRAGSLRDAGVAVAAGTDAPFGHPDPWRAIAAAVTRRTASGAVLGAGERVAASTALAWWMGDATAPLVSRSVRPGCRTDLCVLDRPLSAMLTAPDSIAVTGTLGRAGITGRLQDTMNG
jgi:predicted amidohydrolase YtcJ